MPPPAEPDTLDFEIQLFLEAVLHVCGIDFRDYAPDSLKRRILALAEQDRCKSILELIEKVLHDGSCRCRIVNALTIHVTEMFRDPSFFHAFRTEVIPLLRTYPHLRIWHPGCSSGEEVYSLAIVLHEENLLNRVRIYATDINEYVLSLAKEGIYPLKSIQSYTQNYMAAGGRESFSMYYTAKYNNAIINSELREKIVWAQHDLSRGTSFNEFNCIMCRNVLIYFTRQSQQRIFKSLHESLVKFGFLCLGITETLYGSGLEPFYRCLDSQHKIYQRVA